MSDYFENRNLIERCIDGHQGSQFELYDKYSKAMFNICTRMMKSQVEAEDLLQVSFIDVFRNLSKYRYESTLGSWIKRIVINNCVTEIKRKKIYFEEITDRTVIIADIDDDLRECHLTIPMVNLAMKQLPDGYKAVFTLYLFEGYDHKEIGEILSISEATSKSQFSRAKKKMRDILSTEMVLK